MCVTSVDCCWCSFLVLFILYFCSFNNVACLSNCHEFCRSNVYRRGSLSVIFLYDLFLHFPVVGYRYRQTNWGLLGHVSEAKRERRRAERQWLKCGLEVHKQIFRSACKLFSNIVQQAKSTFFNTKILACTSSKQLFSIANTLLGKSDLISTVLYSIRTSAEVLWLLCEQNLYNPWQSQFPDPASTSRHSHGFRWIPTDRLPPCVRIDSTRSVEQDRHQNMRTGPSSVVVTGWTHWWPSPVFYFSY